MAGNCEADRLSGGKIHAFRAFDFLKIRDKIPAVRGTEDPQQDTLVPYRLARLPDALWVCGCCPYFTARLPEEGRCPLCVSLLIGQCLCGSVVMGREAHSCGKSEMALNIVPLPRATEWPSFRYTITR